MLASVKDALRVNGTDLDGEIKGLIAGAKADLSLSGVHESKIKDDDPLIIRAVTLYCKAQFGYEEPKMADRFERSYISLKQHLTLSAEYTEVADGGL